MKAFEAQTPRFRISSPANVPAISLPEFRVR
jgi:hypothetical protein